MLVHEPPCKDVVAADEQPAAMYATKIFADPRATGIAAREQQNKRRAAELAARKDSVAADERTDQIASKSIADLRLKQQQQKQRYQQRERSRQPYTRYYERFRIPEALATEIQAKLTLWTIEKPASNQHHRIPGTLLPKFKPSELSGPSKSRCQTSAIKSSSSSISTKH